MDLTRVWESNRHTLELRPADEEWMQPHWRMLVPVSRRKKDCELPLIDGNKEKPLVIVVEFSDVFEELRPDQADFEDFFGSLSRSLVGYTDFHIYDAIQKRSSSPW